MSETDIQETMDPLEGLEERLQSHNQAFESLLALTPAREYYGSHFVDGRDPSEQWNRKKQTKEEKRAARKAKLDPANQKSALDVMREAEAKAKAKRKREEDGEGADGEEEEVDHASKRPRGADDADTAEARRAEKVQKKKEKRQRKKEKVEQQKVKAEEKKARKQQRQMDEAEIEAKESTHVDGEEPADTNEIAQLIDSPEDLEKLDFSGLADPEEEGKEDEPKDDDSMHSSAPTTPILESPAFDLATNHSVASSSSSIDPPTEPAPPSPTQRPDIPPAKPTIDTSSAVSAPSTKPKDPPSGTSSPKLQLPHINDEELQARLRARIEALRAARKADGPDGKPVKSRQDLLDQRRKKEEQRKANKKAQRQKAKEDEQRKREEQLRGSGSPLSRADIFSPQPRETNNFSFSRLAFQDGSSTNANMTELHDPRKKKGPQDPRTALQAAQARDAKVAGYDAEKKASIAEKDMWFNARQRAGGERGRDDTSLLKKALKRKEKGKAKSERDWKEREEAVVKGREMKQKKREANLLKRREEKGGKGKKGGAGSKKKGGAGNGKKRPGFEGRFKA